MPVTEEADKAHTARFFRENLMYDALGALPLAVVANDNDQDKDDVGDVAIFTATYDRSGTFKGHVNGPSGQSQHSYFNKFLVACRR